MWLWRRILPEFVGEHVGRSMSLSDRKCCALCQASDDSPVQIVRTNLQVRSAKYIFNIDLEQIPISFRIRTLKPNQMANATSGHRFLWHVPEIWRKGVPSLSISIDLLDHCLLQSCKRYSQSASVCAGHPEQNRHIPRKACPWPGNEVTRLLTVLSPSFNEAQADLHLLTLTKSSMCSSSLGS